jgi:transposase InsO family protein
VRFAFIEAEKAHFPVTRMCTTLQVSCSGFYAWRTRPLAPRHQHDQRLRVEVAAIYAEKRCRYGSPRIERELRAKGHCTGRKRVARLMVEQGLRARPKRRFRTTTDSRHGLPLAANVLQREFTVAQPNVAWVTDITYIWTQEGWLYLAVILDLFSRRVVGWSMSAQITRQLALDALTMGLAQRQPDRGLLHHSDRGSQYASGDYRQLLDQHGIVCSMSRKANCWDNAVAESFFATLKTELVYQCAWVTRAEARGALFEYLEIFYNAQRRHSSLGYLSPVAFEQQYEQHRKTP